MTNREFKAFREIVKTAPETDAIWCAGYLWLDLTDNQIMTLWEDLKENPVCTVTDDVLHLPHGFEFVKREEK